MTTVVDGRGFPVEIAPGRGDLRFSSFPFTNVRRDSGATSRVGRTPISYGELYATQPWIGAAVGWLLRSAIRVPLNCYRKKSNGERTKLDPSDHQLARIIERPWLGANSSQAALIQALLGPLAVHGNAVLEITSSGGDDYLNPLDWRTLTPLGPDSGLDLTGWRWELGGDRRDIPLSKSIHAAWWSPLGPLGVSPLEQLGTTIAIEDAAQRYQENLFQYGARPPSAVTTSMDFITMESQDRSEMLDSLRQDINELYAGPENAGKPALLPPGLEWKEVGHSAVEAELIQQRQVAREEVAAVYQIPPPMIGILDNATYSNIETQKEMAYTMSLGPPLVLIEQILTATLARDFYGDPDLYVEFDFGPVLRGDRQQEIAAFRDGIASAVFTPNEARRAFNLPASKEKDADKLFLPANNLKPLGSEPPPPPQPAIGAVPPQTVPFQEAPVTGGALVAGNFQEEPGWRDSKGQWRKGASGPLKLRAPKDVELDDDPSPVYADDKISTAADKAATALADHIDEDTRLFLVADLIGWANEGRALSKANRKRAGALFLDARDVDSKNKPYYDHGIASLGVLEPGPLAMAFEVQERLPDAELNGELIEAYRVRWPARADAEFELKHPRGPGGEWIPKIGIPALDERHTTQPLPVNPDLGHVRTKRDDEVLGVGVRDTYDKHTNANGEYTAERKELHRQIVVAMLSGHQEGRDRPEVLLTAGGPASGKSFVIDSGRVNNPDDAVHLDQDIVKKMIPENAELTGIDPRTGKDIPGMTVDSSASDAVHREAADIYEMAFREATRRRMNMVAEGTGDSNSMAFANRVQGLHDAGYKTRVVEVTLPTQVALDHAVDRAKKIGRAVPEAGLRAMHANVSRWFPQLADKVNTGAVDELTLWDMGDYKLGDTPKKIAEGGGGKLTISDRILYDLFLKKADENPGTLIQLPTYI